ncbi:MAG: hypothetical protein JNM30_14940 [Rhodospirillales bacterium]|nr:hypothetical protein [Rhodospirillales bacterium]
MAAEAAPSLPPPIDPVPDGPDLDAAARPSDIQGFVDAFEQRRAYGWAFDRAHPQAKLRIELRFDDRQAGETIANRARPDLLTGGVGDGACAFEVAVEDDRAPTGSMTVVAVNPATGARHILPGPAAAAAPAAATSQDAAKVESLLELLQASQRRALTAMQSAERKFDDAATRLSRIPDLSRLNELSQSLDQIRATQGDLARRIAEAEVFLVRFDSVLNGMEKAGKQREPEATINRQSLLVIGLGILTTVATIAAIVMAVWRH